MRLAAAAGSGTPISARAWPADSWPDAISAFTSSGSLVSRIMLATWLRLLPTILAISSWLRLNSSASA